MYIEIYFYYKGDYYMPEINTNMKYEGLVDLCITINGKKTKINAKNNGLPNLFRLISKALAGHDISKEKMSHIDLRYNTAEDEVFKSCLTRKQSLSQLTYGLDNGSWITRAASTIPYSALAFSSFSLLSAKSFRLYLMSKDYDLAYVEIDGTVLEKITPGTQALVEWVLKISNYAY